MSKFIGNDAEAIAMAKSFSVPTINAGNPNHDEHGQFSSSPEGAKGVWKLFKNGSPRVAEMLATALHNGGVHDPETKRNLPKEIDHDRLSRSLANVWKYAHEKGETEVIDATEHALHHMGSHVVDKKGDIIKFNTGGQFPESAYYEGPKEGGVFIGDRVKVKRPAIVEKHEHGETVHLQGSVERI